VDVPFHGVNNQTYDILEADYNFNVNNNLSDNVLSIKVNRKLPDITDTVKDLLLELKKLQSQDMTTSDVITRFQYTTGSLGIRQSGCSVYTRSIAGDALIWGNATFGIWESGLWRSDANISFVLGNLQASVLGSSLLGANLSTFQLNWSGGYF